jgi:hypothetical protein
MLEHDSEVRPQAVIVVAEPTVPGNVVVKESRNVAIEDEATPHAIDKNRLLPSADIGRSDGEGDESTADGGGDVAETNEERVSKLNKTCRSAGLMLN